MLPQAFRVVLPTLGNYLISLFKDTSLASVVTVQELMFSGQIIAARNFQYFTVYTVTAILYFAVCYPSGSGCPLPGELHAPRLGRPRRGQHDRRPRGRFPATKLQFRRGLL